MYGIAGHVLLDCLPPSLLSPLCDSERDASQPISSLPDALLQCSPFPRWLHCQLPASLLPASADRSSHPVPPAPSNAACHSRQLRRLLRSLRRIQSSVPLQMCAFVPARLLEKMREMISRTHVRAKPERSVGGLILCTFPLSTIVLHTWLAARNLRKGAQVILQLGSHSGFGWLPAPSPQREKWVQKPGLRPSSLSLLLSLPSASAYPERSCFPSSDRHSPSCPSLRLIEQA